AAAAGQDVHRQYVRGAFPARGGEDADRALHRFGGERLAGGGDVPELVDELFGEFHARRRAGEGDDVATGVDIDVGEAFLDRPQHLVIAAQQGNHGHVGGQLHLTGGQCGGQIQVSLSRRRWPSLSLPAAQAGVEHGNRGGSRGG